MRLGYISWHLPLNHLLLQHEAELCTHAPRQLIMNRIRSNCRQCQQKWKREKAMCDLMLVYTVVISVGSPRDGCHWIKRTRSMNETPSTRGRVIRIYNSPSVRPSVRTMSERKKCKFHFSGRPIAPTGKSKKKCASLVRGGIILRTRIVAEAARRHYPLERLFFPLFSCFRWRHTKFCCVWKCGSGRIARRLSELKAHRMASLACLFVCVTGGGGVERGKGYTTLFSGLSARRKGKEKSEPLLFICLNFSGKTEKERKQSVGLFIGMRQPCH